jgi:hypothetical protein
LVRQRQNGTSSDQNEEIPRESTIEGEKMNEVAADEFTQSLDQDLAPGWKPVEGDVVVGKVTALTRGWSDYTQSYYPILTIHDEASNEDVSVHAFHTALRSRLEALRPSIGDRVGIKMGPKLPLKNRPSQTVQTYTVKVEGKTEDVWGNLDKPKTTASRVQQDAPASEVQDDSDIPF